MNILFEYDLNRRFVSADIIDQSEGGAQFIAGKVNIRVGSFAIVKASSGWPLPEKRATAKVVWASEDDGRVRFGCEYLSPMVGLPNFF